MKYAFNTRLEKILNLISYQIVYKETSKITTKKKMIQENNEKIVKEQI